MSAWLIATPQVNVVTTATGYPEAQDMMKSGRVAGILYLPDDFEDRVAVVKSLFSSCTRRQVLSFTTLPCRKLRPPPCWR